MKDALGSTLGKGDLVAYSPQSNYTIRIAIVVDPTKNTILSGTCLPDGNVSIRGRVGSAISSRLVKLASRYETDDYETIYDDFIEKLQEMNIKI